MFRIILQALETTKVWRLEMWSDERRQRGFFFGLSRYFSNVCGLWPSSTLDAIHVDTWAV